MGASTGLALLSFPLKVNLDRIIGGDMDTSLVQNDTSAPPPLGGQSGTPIVIPLSVMFNVVVAIFCAALSYHLIFVVDRLPNLGDVERVFLGLVVFVPVVMAVFSDYFLLQKSNQGRHIALVIYFVGMVLALALLLSQWGFFLGFEYITDGIVANSVLMLGFPIAYAIYWVGGRVGDDEVISPLQERLDMIAGGLAALTLFAMLIASDILGGLEHLLRTYSEPETWALTIATVIFAMLFGKMLMLSDYFGEDPAQRVMWQGWLMLSPNVIGFAIFFAGPLLFSFYLSFTDAQLGSSREDAEGNSGPNFIGLDNFSELLSVEIQTTDANPAEGEDVFDGLLLSDGYDRVTAFELGDTRYILGAKKKLFWISMFNTLVFCLLLLPLAIIPALALSIILNSKIPGMKFFRAVYFLPSVAAVVGSALIWQWLYSSSATGYINYVISQMVDFLNGTLGMSITDPEIQWLNDPAVVLISVVILAAWQVIGYNTVLFLAGLQGIPKVLYEASMIDGANKWQQFRFVTLPMLSPTMFFVLITTMVTGLQAFNEPYALFPNQGVPDQARTAVFHMYDQAFGNATQFGESSAIAWLLFIIIFGITLLQFRLQRSDAY